MGDAFALANTVCIIRMFMVKKFVIWPFIPVFVGGYLYRQQDYFMLFNKKFFDMLNVGEQYQLGHDRNEVLKKCNTLLGVEDF